MDHTYVYCFGALRCGTAPLDSYNVQPRFGAILLLLNRPILANVLEGKKRALHDWDVSQCEHFGGGGRGALADFSAVSKVDDRRAFISFVLRLAKAQPGWRACPLNSFTTYAQSAQHSLDGISLHWGRPWIFLSWIEWLCDSVYQDS